MARRDARRAAVVLLLTCEHGGNVVPRRYAGLFRGRSALLRSHRGWDPGALVLAGVLSRRLRAPLLAASVTRLVVDLNRSPDHPAVFSAITRGLPGVERNRIMARHYHPYRNRVAHAVANAHNTGNAVVHVGVHSFTPVLRGKRRRTDIGLLYDPSRVHERALAERWRDALGVAAPGLRVRMNDPYRGTSDGLTTTLRRACPRVAYAGLELEVNQRLVRGPAVRELFGAIARALDAALVAPRRRVFSVRGRGGSSEPVIASHTPRSRVRRRCTVS